MKFLSFLTSKIVGLLAFIGLYLFSEIASAADVSASITSAFSDANTNMTTVVTGVIALAAIVTGVGLIYRFLTK